jgi:ectoine hydroxylase-related dioxygenase (phytanoyl-CoA dioxygenase family)
LSIGRESYHSAASGRAPVHGSDTYSARMLDFQRDGACVIRGLLTPAELERLAEGVEENLAAPSDRAVEGGGETGTGTRSVRLHHDHLLVKDPDTTIRTPWHQDQPFYDIDGSDTVSLWIPLDPVPRESTLEFVAGSHAAGTWYMPRGFFDDRPMVFEEGTLEEVPDIEAERDAHTILGWELEPGDAVAFNMLTLHAAGGSRHRRRAFSVRIVGDDVRLAARPHPTSPSFPELDGVLAPGDPLDHPLFPVLWTS